jgi:hypothetical protein
MASYKDYKTIAAARRAGSIYYVDRKGNKMLAVTKGTLDKWKAKNKGSFKGSALTAWANMKGKDFSAIGKRTSGAVLTTSRPVQRRSTEVSPLPAFNRSEITETSLTDEYVKKIKSTLDAVAKEKRETVTTPEERAAVGPAVKSSLEHFQLTEELNFSQAKVRSTFGRFWRKFLSELRGGDTKMPSARTRVDGPNGRKPIHSLYNKGGSVPNLKYKIANCGASVPAHKGKRK